MTKGLLGWLGGKSKALSAPVREPPTLRTMADVDAIIANGGFEPAADTIRERVLPCVHVTAAGVSTGAIGASRFGGLPDLPVGAAWPRSVQGQPMLFLAQVDLADITQQAGGTTLGAEGLLSVFVGDLDGAWETRAVAILTPPGVALSGSEPPDVADGVESYPEFRVLDGVSVTFAPGLTLPANDAAFEEALQRLTPDGDFDALETAPPAGPDVAIAQILGHAKTTQERLQSAIAFVELGHAGKEDLLHWTSWEDWEQAKKMENRLKGGMIHRPWRAEDDGVVRWILESRELIDRETAQWQVLLMVTSNKPMGFWINDADPVFVFIRTDDLKAGDFSRLRVLATQS